MSGESLPARFGRFELLQRLSAGRMAEVFKGCVAGAAGVENTLAIKRILDSLTDDEVFIKAFIKEARISSSLRHPNIGQVYEFGEIDGQYYIAMEWVRGRDLMAVLEYFRNIGRTMPVAVAIRIVLEVCKALDYAHTRCDATGKPLALVHRDVSPPNILISFEGAVKLIDFGVAKALASHPETATGPLKAKCAYLSPELVSGQEIDQRSDIFALGSVFFEMVTGRRLFLGDSDMETLARLRRAEVPRPSQMNNGLPPAVEAIILKMLAREPEGRYQGADLLHDVLERVAMDASLGLSTLQLARWMTGTFPIEGPSPALGASEPEVTLEDVTLPGPSAGTLPGVGKELPPAVNQSMARAAAFAARRPQLADRPVDLDALDFALREGLDETASQSGLEAMPTPAGPPETPILLTESCVEILVEHLEAQGDEEPTRRMTEPGWDELVTQPRRASPLPPQSTRELIARSEFVFQPGPLEPVEGGDPSAPGTQDATVVDQPLPYASTEEVEEAELSRADEESDEEADTLVADVEIPKPPSGESR